MKSHITNITISFPIKHIPGVLFQMFTQYYINSSDETIFLPAKRVETATMESNFENSRGLLKNQKKISI